VSKCAPSTRAVHVCCGRAARRHRLRARAPRRDVPGDCSDPPQRRGAPNPPPCRQSGISWSRCRLLPGLPNNKAFSARPAAAAPQGRQAGMASSSVALQAPATGCGTAAHARHAPCLRPRPAHAQPAASCSGSTPAAAAPVQPQRRGWGQRRAPAPVRAAAAGQQEALWENQVRDGRVKSVDARGAGEIAPGTEAASRIVAESSCHNQGEARLAAAHAAIFACPVARSSVTYGAARSGPHCCFAAAATARPPPQRLAAL
jgi:hypothetical protein